MMRIKLLAAAATTALLVAPAALAQTAPATPPAAPAAPAAQTPAAAENVIDVLKMHGRFTTLLQVLDQAQLTETLATRPRSGRVTTVCVTTVCGGGRCSRGRR